MTGCVPWTTGSVKVFFVIGYGESSWGGGARLAAEVAPRGPWLWDFCLRSRAQDVERMEGFARIRWPSGLELARQNLLSPPTSFERPESFIQELGPGTIRPSINAPSDGTA